MTGNRLARLRRAVIGVPDSEALAFSHGDSPRWKHLETVVLTAVGGYHAVLDGHRLGDLVPVLDRTPLELRGYAYEGAAMGLTGMDCFLPGSRFTAYLEGPGSPHVYMVHIGAGEALARLRRKPEPFLQRLPGFGHRVADRRDAADAGNDDSTSHGSFRQKQGPIRTPTANRPQSNVKRTGNRGEDEAVRNRRRRHPRPCRRPALPAAAY